MVQSGIIGDVMSVRQVFCKSVDGNAGSSTVAGKPNLDLEYIRILVGINCYLLQDKMDLIQLTCHQMAAGFLAEWCRVRDQH